MGERPGAMGAKTRLMADVVLNPIVVEDLKLIDAAVVRRDAFADAVVLVTGCAGFLGFYFLQYFVHYAGELGVRKVIGLDTFLLDEPSWLTQLASEHSEVLQLCRFNVAKDAIEKIGEAKHARYILHMASIASPSFYRRYPVETIDANIWGLRRLLDFYRNADGIRGLLFFSSSEIYGNPDPSSIPTDEHYRGNVACVGPRSCYDESKRFGETLCYVFANQYGMPITVVRPFNNYGPGMRLTDRRLPADFAKCVVDGRDIVILSNGTPTRTFCYVTDAIGGYLKCLLHGKFDCFNIGIEKPEIPVARLAAIYQETGRRVFGYEGRVRYEASSDSDYLTDNPNRRCPVIDKARQKLGYDPQVLVEEGVARYLRFLKHEQGR
jgi:UDP-glucuronate decarboxylase